MPAPHAAAQLSMGVAGPQGRERVPREAIDSKTGVIGWELQQARPIPKIPSHGAMNAAVGAVPALTGGAPVDTDRLEWTAPRAKAACTDRSSERRD